MAESFDATVELFGKTATGFRVPPEVVAALGSSKRPPVEVSVGTHTYRSTIATYGDEFFLPLNRANREGAGLHAGDSVTVTLQLDMAPRTVEVPAIMRSAFEDAPAARKHFDNLSYSHQREYVEWINEAKREETRLRRAAKTVEMLTEGRTHR